MRRAGWIGLGLAVIILVGLALAGSLARFTGRGAPTLGQGQALPEPRPGGRPRGVPVRVVPVRRQALEATGTYFGVLEPRATVNLTPKISGRVARRPVDVGDRVKAGDLLVQMETGELEAQVRRAEAALAAARARLQGLRDGPTAQQLEQAEAALEQARARLDNARKEFERTEALYRSGAVSRQAYDAASTTWQQAEAQVRAAQAQRDAVRTGPTQHELEAAEAQVREAQATLELARLQLGNASLRAPMAGVVSRIGAEVGETISPGSAVVSLVDLEELKATFQAPGREALRMRPGAPVTVEAGAVPGVRFTGRVHRVDPVADPRSRLFGVEVAVPNPEGRLRAGLDVTLRISLEQVQQARVVPEEAVTTLDGRTGVFVVEEGRARFEPVDLGLGNGVLREVQGALEEGQLVVTAGKEFLSPGSAVVVEEQG